MCSWHIFRLECSSFFLYLLPTSLWWSLSRVPAALFSPAWPRGSHLSQVPMVDKSLGGIPLRTWLFHGRTGGIGSVGLLPVTQRTFWLQNHCKAWEFPGGKEKARVLVLALQGLQRWRAYSDDLPSAYNPLATAQTSILYCKMKLRWWLERGQGCLSSLWKDEVVLQWELHKGTWFGNMWLYFTILLLHPDPHAKSPWSPLGPLALMSQTICSQ